jgi:hypothetical protein
MTKIFSKIQDSKRMETLRYYYEVLGVRPGASLQEINQAYINLLNELQPSRLSDDTRRQQKAQSIAQEINEAYREIKKVYSLRRGEQPSVEEYATLDFPVERTAHTAVPVRDAKEGTVKKSTAVARASLKGARSLLFLVVAVVAIVIAIKAFSPSPVARQGAAPASPAPAARKSTTQPPKPATGHGTASASQLPAARRNDAHPPAAPAARQSATPAPARKPAAGQGSAPAPAANKAAPQAAAVTQPGDRAVSHATAVRQAAERGDSVAQGRLGYLYMNGKGVPQDYGESARWYRKAAEQGHAGGEYWLGYLCETGQGVQQNSGEAARWYRKAAEQGDAEAQKRLALLYLQGRGVAKDPREAEKWYRKAAGQGDADAQSALEGLTAR